MRTIKNVLILAGGDSTRFWPLSHKSLFRFLGQPLILYQIEELKKYAENIIIVSHKDSALAFKRLVENLGTRNIQVIVQKEEEPGQAGAVLSAGLHVHGEALILNANDIIDFSILSKITNTPPGVNKIVLFGKKLSEYFPGGYFKFDGGNKPAEIVEKPAPVNRPSKVVKLVLDYISDIGLFLKAIRGAKPGRDDRYERAINSLLATDLDRAYFQYDGIWGSLKYPWHVLSMMKILLLGIKKEMIPSSCQISKKAVIVGPVLFGENVKVGDFAKIVGPTFIGNNTIVGDYSMVRESQIGEDCLVGAHSEVARSSIGNGVFLHRNYVGDTVMDDRSMMGAGAITANFRFDAGNISSYIEGNKIDSGLGKFGAVVGAGSKIGVNATLTPGVKIGKNCLIAPTEIVGNDLKDNVFLIKGKERTNLNK